MQAGTVVWNGPVGVFEMDAVRRTAPRPCRWRSPRPKAFTLAGGGDTVAAIQTYKIEDKVGYISTAGGAFLEFLEGKKLPAVDILESAREGLIKWQAIKPPADTDIMRLAFSWRLVRLESLLLISMPAYAPRSSLPSVRPRIRPQGIMDKHHRGRSWTSSGSTLRTTATKSTPCSAPRPHP
jgi:hypothetical protein